MATNITLKTNIEDFTDEELEAMLAQTEQQPAAPAAAAVPEPPKSIRDFSDDELNQMLEEQPEPPGFFRQAGEALLSGMIKVGQAVDSVTGAPTRAAVFKIQEGGSFLDAIGQAVEQFAEDPEQAPTGEQIAVKAGIDPNDKVEFTLGAGGPSEVPVSVPAGKFYGFLVDLALDPTNLIPGVAASKATAKAAAKGTVKAAKTAGKLAVGGAEIVAPTAVRAGRAVAKSADEAADSIRKFLNPKQSPDLDELAEIASRHGIGREKLGPVEFPEGSFLQQQDLAKRSVAGDDALFEFQETVGQIRGALRDEIDKIGGGAVLDTVEAGEFMQKAYNRGFDRVFGSLEETYSKVVKDFPGLKISDRAVKGAKSPKAMLDSALNGIEKFAKGRLQRGVTEEFQGQARSLLNTVAAIRRTNGSVKQSVEALRDIGDAAFKKGNLFARTPPDVAKMRKLYGDLSDAIKQTIRQDVKDGPAIVKQLELDNAAVSKFFGDRAPLEALLGNANKAPEQIFRGLVSAGNTKTVRALKEILDPQDFQVIKAAAINTLLKGDDFSFARLSNQLRDRAFLYREILDPSEFAEIADLVRLGDRFGPARLSAPAVGKSGVFRDLTQAAKESVIDEAVTKLLKDRARGVGLRAPTAAEAAEAATRGGIRLPKRTKTDVGLKAAQVLSTQQRSSQRERK